MLLVSPLDEFEPCESPEVDGGVRDPHNIAPGNTYTLGKIC